MEPIKGVNLKELVKKCEIQFKKDKPIRQAKAELVTYRENLVIRLNDQQRRLHCWKRVKNKLYLRKG